MNPRTFLSPVLAFALSLLLAPDAEALLPTAAEPRFHIQAIEVRGARHGSSDIIASESLLESGQVYTESELYAAVQRIRRLPFVLDADFMLGKGRERGTYVLLVDVHETKRFFYRLDVEESRFGEPLALESTGTLEHNLVSNVTAGTRLYLGRYGELFAAAGSEGVQAGYTRYNLFRKGVTFAVGLSAETCCTAAVTPLGLDPAYSAWIDDSDAASATVSLGVPLSVHQSVHGSIRLRESGEGLRRSAVGDRDVGDFDFQDRREEELRLAWHYDTTDDPVFPSEGTELVVAVDYRTLEADLASAATVRDMSSELLRVSVLGRRHWPLARHQTLAAGLTLAVGRASVENLPLPTGEVIDESLDSWELAATIRHSMRLDRAKKARFREVYWQNRLEYSLDHTSPGGYQPYRPLELAAVSSSVVFRSAWGIVRFGLRLIDVGDVL